MHTYVLVQICTFETSLLTSASQSFRLLQSKISCQHTHTAPVEGIVCVPMSWFSGICNSICMSMAAPFRLPCHFCSASLLISLGSGLVRAGSSCADYSVCCSTKLSCLPRLKAAGSSCILLHAPFTSFASCSPWVLGRPQQAAHRPTAASAAARSPSRLGCPGLGRSRLHQAAQPSGLP